jgi:hypothetical protein
MAPVEMKAQEEYDLEKKEVPFFNLFDLHFQREDSVIGFYNLYRDLVITSLKKKGDIITWQNNRVLPEDEELSPTFEELILANVLGLIDTRLPGYVRDYYFHFSGKSKSLMDYQRDILSRVPAFLRGIDDGLPAVSKNEVDQPARYGTIIKELKHRVPVADQGFFLYIM